MRKYGKWVLSLSLLAASPGLTFAAEASPTTGSKSSRVDNQRVAEDIANALRGRLKGEIGIEYKEGVAILSGSVFDAKTKKLASSLVEKVPNVSRVDNRLGIVEKKRAFSERLRGTGSPGDEVVQAGHEGEKSSRSRVQQVNAEIPALPPPAGSDYDGVPVSPGLPGGAAQASSAQNQEIAEQIGAALSGARLDGYDIQIRFQNGICTLDGAVGTQGERANATRVVSAIPGVRSVANRLQAANEPAGGPYAGPYAGQPGGPYAGQPGGPYAGNRGPNPYGPPRGDIRGAGYMQQVPNGQPGGPGQPYYPGYQAGPPAGGGMPMGPGGAPPYPPSYGSQGGGASQAVYNSPSMPDHAWPTYAQYPNSAAVSYPQQYSASAWPYIGPFYPYPQVPLGWRDATLRWDDGQWNLMFKPRTDRWWWFFNPNNW